MAHRIGRLTVGLGAAWPALAAQSSLPWIVPTFVIGLLTGALMVLGLLLQMPARGH